MLPKRKARVFPSGGVGLSGLGSSIPSGGPTMARRIKRAARTVLLAIPLAVLVVIIGVLATSSTGDRETK